MYYEASITLSRPSDTQYIPEARTFFGIMQGIQKGLSVKHWERTTPFGVKFILDEINGSSFIQIISVDPADESPCLSGLGGVPYTDMYPDGWGLPYTTQNLPLGTPGGDFPDTLFSLVATNSYFNSGFLATQYTLIKSPTEVPVSDRGNMVFMTSRGSLTWRSQPTLGLVLNRYTCSPLGDTLYLCGDR